jgi:hypothetical protein
VSVSHPALHPRADYQTETPHLPLAVGLSRSPWAHWANGLFNKFGVLLFMVPLVLDVP